MNKLEVVIPVYNEQESIKELVERIDAALVGNKISYSVIFVDDRSTDNTKSEILALTKKYPVFYHLKQGKQGKAYSIIEGAKLAKSEVLAMIDGDLQYPPEKLPEMYKLIKNHGVVVANRKKHHTSRFRKLASKVNSKVFGKFLMGFDCDAQSGLKMFRKEILEHIDEKSMRPWSFDMPLLHAASELGFTIGCVEMEFLSRKNGESKVSFIKATKEIVTTALRLKLKRKKIYKINSKSNSVVGSGVVYRRKRFITHTDLPHEDSALTTFTTFQKLAFASLVTVFLGSLLASPLNTLIIFTAILTVIYAIDVFFGLFVLIKSLHFPPEMKFKKEEIDVLSDKELPVYTILCPLYREGNVLPHFLKAINELDWPKSKLDVKLLLEEDDTETIEIARKLGVPRYVDIVVVPHSMPKTKPKACNFGLAHAKGEYVVIYDAEDRPDADQLKKAYLGFRRAGKNTICLQSKLNYFNPNYNLLTRLFTAEYSLWFDVILPGLQSIETHIPLGGTSNHFRTRDLQGVHAWDPFNVTEDCDLGVRLFKKGYKTAIIDSTTLEEANSSLRNWLRQRSRWIKGYFQTYLVHTRNPIRFVREHGLHALIFQLVIGMRMSFMIVNPLLWLTTSSYFLFRPVIGEYIEAIYPGWVFYVAVFALLVGNFMYIFNYMIGAAKREHWGVVKYVFLIPFYWLAASVSAMIALYQLIVKPHYWEKTHHGLNLAKKEKLAEDKAKRIEISKVRSWAKSGLVGGGVLVFASSLANVSSFLYNAYLGRNVDLAEFGTVSLIGSIFTFTSVFTGSFGKTIVYKTAYFLGKYKKPTDDLLKKMEKRAWVLSFVLTAAWIGAIPLMAYFFNAEILPFVLFAPALTVGVISSLYSGYLWGNLKFSVVGGLMLAESVIRLIAAIVLVELGFSNYVYTAIPLASIVSFLISWIFVRRIKKVTAGEPEAQSFSLGFYGTSILNKISSTAFLSLDIVLAKHLLSPEDAGSYALLSLAGKMVYFLGTLFNQFLIPLVSSKVGEGKETKEVFLKLLGATLASSIIGLIAVGLFGPITLPLLFGENARNISEYSLIYTYAMTGFLVASSVITYHQVRKHYTFPVIGVIASILLAFAILASSKTIYGIAYAQASIATIQLGIVILAHAFYSQIVSASWLTKEFFGLFAPIRGVSNKKSDKLRILVFNWRDTKHIWSGGAEVYMQELAKRWARAGHHVVLFCGNDRKSKMNEKVEGIQVIRRGGFYTVYVWAAFYYIFKFSRKFDVVIESVNGVPFFTPLYSRARKVAVIYHVHSRVFKEHLKFPMSAIAGFAEGKLLPIFYRKTKIVTISKTSKLGIESLGFGSRRPEIIYPGISIESFRRYKKTSYPLFSYIGRLKDYKNVDIAIEAFSNVVKTHKNARLLIAGDGEAKRRLNSLVIDMNLSENVEFLGRVSEEDKAKILGRSWASIQPSSIEGWGITVIEANAAGTPVIASNVEGLKESVVDGRTGILVPVRDHNALTKVMLDLVKYEKFRKELSDNAYDWSKNFSWEKAAEEFLRIIEEEKGINREVAFAAS